MAYVDIGGPGLFIPKPPYGSGSASGALLVDATGEKAAMVGRISYLGNDATKTLNQAGWRFGTVVKAGGSALTVSLQDVGSNGSIGVPDETQDQTLAIANGDSTFASATFTGLKTFGSTRAVAKGDLIAIVWEFDGSGRLGSDSFTVTTYPTLFMTTMLETGVVLKTGGSWSAQSGLVPNVVFGFNDGTYGMLEGSDALSLINAVSMNLNSAGSDEFGSTITLPYNAKMDGFWFYAGPANIDADFEVILYSGTTALKTVTVDASFARTLNSNQWNCIPCADQTLTANTQYRVAIRPTTTNNVISVSHDYGTAGFLDLFCYGQNAIYTSRLNQGSWSDTTTRRALMGVRIRSIDIPSGVSMSRVRSGF